jgi:Flp pilus assembly protein TadD
MIIKFPGNKIKTLSLEEIKRIIDEGDFDNGIIETNRYLHKFPESSPGWTILGHAMNAVENLTEALKAYQHAIKIDDNNAESHIGLGIVFRKLDQDNKAREHYLRALEIDPENPWAFSSLSVIELRNFQDSAALENALKAYHLKPDDPGIAANLSVAYHYNGKFTKRDKLLKIAENLGYQNSSRIQQFFSGELTIRK